MKDPRFIPVEEHEPEEEDDDDASEEDDDNEEFSLSEGATELSDGKRINTLYIAS
jgi:hypothetical protein